jgi:hypothetical protein
VSTAVGSGFDISMTGWLVAVIAIGYRTYYIYVSTLQAVERRNDGLPGTVIYLFYAMWYIYPDIFYNIIAIRYLL